MLATKPIPHASCSCAGSYRPWACGRPLFGFRRVILGISIRPLNSIGCSWALPEKGTGASRTLAQEHISSNPFNTAQGATKYNAEFRYKGCEFQGPRTTPAASEEVRRSL